MWQINNRKIYYKLCEGSFYPYGRCTVVLTRNLKRNRFEIEWCRVDYCEDIVIPEDIKKEFEDYMSDPLFEIELEQYIINNGIKRW